MDHVYVITVTKTTKENVRSNLTEHEQLRTRHTTYKHACEHVCMTTYSCLLALYVPAATSSRPDDIIH
jgi:hypothetical protein